MALIQIYLNQGKTDIFCETNIDLSKKSNSARNMRCSVVFKENGKRDNTLVTNGICKVAVY